MAYMPYLWYCPDIVCEYCRRVLDGINNSTHRLEYVQPVIWLPRTEHLPELCYFCINREKTVGIRYEMHINYELVESVMPAVLRSEENPYAPSEILEEPVLFQNSLAPIQGSQQSSVALISSQQSNETAGTIATEQTVHSEYAPSEGEMFTHGIQHLITQSDWNDIVRTGKMSKEVSETIGSRLQQWHLVASDFRVTAARGRCNKACNKAEFDVCFAVHEATKIVYCTDVDRLFQTLGHEHHPEDWQLFIDSSVASLKGVLLHNGNEFPSVPIVYGTNTKENYGTMKLIKDLVNYDLHGWPICCDLKVVGILTGVKQGFSKHQCFLCLWEGRLREFHYTDHQWQPRTTFRLGENSIDHIPLIPSSKIILPPLHIKLELMKNFVRALDHDGDAFAYLKQIFPRSTAAKIDAGI